MQPIGISKVVGITTEIYMKNKSSDPKLHVRKTVAGVATGALLGAAVAGPIGALVGGTVGTVIGNAAEDGRPLKMPKSLRQRTSGMTMKTEPRSKAAAKSSKGTKTSKNKATAKKSSARKKSTSKRSTASRSIASRKSASASKTSAKRKSIPASKKKK